MKAAYFSACLLLAANCLAGELPIDLTTLANEPWTFTGPNDFVITNGSGFPTGAWNFGGVPFMISAGPNNYWAGGAAANFGSGAVSLTIPIGVYGVRSVFTILNSMWGQFGPNAYLFLTFTGSDGAHEEVRLVGNIDVRDYNNDGGDNAINGTSTVQVWSNGKGQRLDRQDHILAKEFATQTLTSVTLTDTGNEVFSRAILAALTVGTCGALPTENLAIAPKGIVFHQGTGDYSQIVGFTNQGTSAIEGPVYLIVEDLPAGVTILNKSDATMCYSPLGSPYIEVLPKGASMAPQTTAYVKLQFSDPSGMPIAYTPLTVNGSGGTP
jgi:hypothetical protein